MKYVLRKDQIFKFVNFKHKDSEFYDTFYVKEVSYGGGGSGHGQHDIYPDGHFVTAFGLNCAKEISFYQSGCFNNMIYPINIELISGPEDKEVKLIKVISWKEI